MLFTLNEQFLCFVWSVACGAVIGVVYDFFRILRLLVFKSKLSSFICDFLFMIIAAFISVTFSMGFTRGNTRYFIVFGEICGVLFVRLTIGRVSIYLIDYISRKILLVFKKISDKIGKFCKKVLQVIRTILYNIIDGYRNRKFNRRGKVQNETKAS